MRTTARSLTTYRPLQTKLDMIHMVKSRINQNTAFAEGIIRRSMSASDYDFPPASFVFIDTGDREEDNQAADSATRLLITLNHYYMNQDVLIQNQYFINQLYRQIDYYMTRLRINSRSEYRELNKFFQQIQNSDAETGAVKTDRNRVEALDRQLERRLFLIANQEAGRQYIRKLKQERVLNQTVSEQSRPTQSLSVPFYRMMRLAAQSSRVSDYKTIWKQSVDRQYSPEARKFLDYLEHMDRSERRDILEMLGEEEHNLYRKLRKVEADQWRSFAAHMTERLEKFHTASIRHIPTDSHYDGMTSLNVTGNDTERIPAKNEFWLSFIREIHSSTSLEKEFYSRIQKSRTEAASFQVTLKEEFLHLIEQASKMVDVDQILELINSDHLLKWSVKGQKDFQPETLSEKKQFLKEWGSYMEPSIWKRFLILFSTKKRLEELTKESYRYIQMTENSQNTSFPELEEQRLNHIMEKEQWAVLDYIRQTDFEKWEELSVVEGEIIPAVSQLTFKNEFINLIEQTDETGTIDEIWTLASTDHILRESSEAWRNYKADTLSEKKELLKEWIGYMDGSEWEHFLTLISESRLTHQQITETGLSNESYSSEVGISETQRIFAEHKNWLSFLQKIQDNRTKFSLFEELSGDDRQEDVGEKTETETEERYAENIIREYDSESSQLTLKSEFFDLIEQTDETGTINELWTLASTDHILRESSEAWRSYKADTLSEKKELLKEWIGYMDGSEWRHFLTLISENRLTHQPVIATELSNESYSSEVGISETQRIFAEHKNWLSFLQKIQDNRTKFSLYEKLSGDDRQVTVGEKTVTETEKRYAENIIREYDSESSQLTLKNEFFDLIEQTDETRTINEIWALASTDHILRESSEAWRSYKTDTMSEKKELLKEWIGYMDGSEWRHFLTLISENRLTHQPVIATELSNESYSSEVGISETQRIFAKHKNWLSFLQKIQDNRTKFSLFEELTRDDRQEDVGKKAETETEERYAENIIREYDSESGQLTLKNEFFDLIEQTDETGTINEIWTLASTDHILRKSAEAWRSYKADTLSEKKELLKEWIGYMDGSEWEHFLTLISESRLTHQHDMVTRHSNESYSSEVGNSETQRIIAEHKNWLSFLQEIQENQTKFSLFEELSGDDRQEETREKVEKDTRERFSANLIREYNSESSQLTLKNEFFDLIEQTEEAGTIDEIWTLASTDHTLQKSAEAWRSHEMENFPEKKERLKKWIEAMDGSELRHFLTLVSTRMKLQELTEAAGVQDASNSTFKVSERERPVLLHFLESLSYEDKAQFYQQLGAQTLFYQKDTGSADQYEAACLANLLEKEQKAESEIFLVQLLQKSMYEEEKKQERRMLWGSTITALYQNEVLTRKAEAWKIPKWSEWDGPDTALRKDSVYSKTKGQDDRLAQTQEAVYESRLLRLMKQMSEQELTQLYELQKTVVAAQTVNHMLNAIRNNSLSYSKREELWNTIAEAVCHNSHLYEKMEQKKMEQLLKAKQSENPPSEPSLKDHSKEQESVDKVLALLRDMTSGFGQRYMVSKPLWNIGTSKKSSLILEDKLKNIAQVSKWIEEQPLRSEAESGSSLEYGPVNLVPGNRDGRAAPGIVRTPQMPVDIETKIEKTVREKMKDINFINRRDVDVSVSPEYESRIRTLADQVEFQKQEIEEIKYGSAKIIQNTDTQKITNTVMKKLREQLQAERLRKGL